MTQRARAAVALSLATRWLPTASVVSIMPVVLTVAWSAGAASDEDVGANLWPVGGAMIFAGMVLGTTVVAVPARIARRRRASPDR